MKEKLWGGRFSKQTDALVHKYNQSLSFDIRLAEVDIDGSISWASGLGKAGLLTPVEVSDIVSGLEQVRQEILGNQFQLAPTDEDVHSAVERRLTELIGPVGGKLHTGRSRNDQVTTDFRLWTMSACQDIDSELVLLQEAIVSSADANLLMPMPGYTHLQHAQPVTWGHFILSHFWPLARDRARFAAARQSADECPLGSAALAGTGFPVDRLEIALDLGFSRVCQNSMDAVAGRDYVADFLYAAAMAGLHLGRLSEQLILFATREFSFIILDDAYSTGSSIMPQKKNPDTLELTRGKSGRLIGHLAGLMATLKGLPSTYDKDLQEDKEPVFDAFDSLMLALPVMSGLIKTLQLDARAMANQLEPGLLATDVADYLVHQGMPFRQAHHIVGQIVQHAESLDIQLTDLALADLKQFSELFDEPVLEILNVGASLAHRSAVGGTSPDALRQQLSAARRELQATR